VLKGPTIPPQRVPLHKELRNITTSFLPTKSVILTTYGSPRV